MKYRTLGSQLSAEFFYLPEVAVKATNFFSINFAFQQNSMKPKTVSGLRWWSPSLALHLLNSWDLDCLSKTQINVYTQEMTSQELWSVQIYRCSTTTTPLVSPLPQVHIAQIKTTLSTSIPHSHLICFIYLVGHWEHKLLLSCVLLKCKLFSFFISQRWGCVEGVRGMTWVFLVGPVSD